MRKIEIINKGRIVGKQKKIGNGQRAADTARIVTIKDGRRIIRHYDSGEELHGTLEQNDAPPFTGYVRGWFRKDRVKK